jgi:hypothetical protein
MTYITVGLQLVIFGLVMHASASAQTPQFCRDQGNDNRPNWCQVLKDNTWVQTKSTCKKISEGDFLFTSCSGVSSHQVGTDFCCIESSECPGAYYVAICVNR